MKLKIIAAALPDMVLEHYETTLFNIASIANDRVKNYLPKKLERRIKSDYINNEKKLKEIYKKITELDKAFMKAEMDLRQLIG